MENNITFKHINQESSNNTFNGAFGHVMQEVTRNKKLSIEAKAIYSYLASMSDNKTGECFPSLDTILSELNISKNRFYKYIKELEAEGIIERYQRKNQSTIYKLVNHIIVKKQDNDKDNKNTEKSTNPQNEPGTILQNEAHNNTLNNTNNNITSETIETEKECYVNNYNHLISKEVKELIAFYAPTIDKAIDIEKDIFGAKKVATRELLQEGVLSHNDLNDKGVYCIDFSEYGLNLKRLMNNIFMKLRRNRDNNQIKNQKAYFFGSLKKSIKEYMATHKEITENPVPLFSLEELGLA